MSKGRSLTSSEIDLAQTVFRNSINYARVKIHHAKYIFFQPDNSGMTPNGEIYVAGQAYTDDFAAGSEDSRCFFIHEMTHVWQYQNRVLRVKTSALLETIRHSFRYDQAYLYTLRRDKDFGDYNLEQQAAIIVDLFRVRELRIDFHRGANGALRVQNPPGEREELLGVVTRRFVTDPGYLRRI